MRDRMRAHDRAGFVSRPGPWADRMTGVATESSSVVIGLGWPYVATLFDVATRFGEGWKSLGRDREFSIVLGNYSLLSLQ